MPVALPIDKDLAKELYTNGMTLTDIAAKTGVKLATLSKWKARDRWEEERLHPDGDPSTAIAASAKCLSNQALTIASRVLTKLEKMAITSPRDARDIASGLSTAYMSARKALGLDDERLGTINITMVNTPGQAFVIDKSAARDVESETVYPSASGDALQLRDAPLAQAAVDAPSDHASDAPA